MVSKEQDVDNLFEDNKSDQPSQQVATLTSLGDVDDDDDDRYDQKNFKDSNRDLDSNEEVGKKSSKRGHLNGSKGGKKKVRKEYSPSERHNERALDGEDSA